MENLLKETLGFMKRVDKTIDDIDWIGSEDFRIPVDRFFNVANVVYDDSYGAQEVASDLIIVFKDSSAMYRCEYDGAEWWKFINLKRPSVERNDITKIVDKGCGYKTLAELNEKVKV